MPDPAHDPVPQPIDIAPIAASLGFPLQPEWHATIRTNLALSLRMAAEVASFPLDDELELAPVFTA